MQRRSESRASGAGVSDDAVRAATGKGWREWFGILDRAGARTLDHKGIVALLRGKGGTSPWWEQMITVAYERARGMRVKHERPDGFSVSATRTLAADAGDAFRAFTLAAQRRRWLGTTQLTITRSTPDKSVRMRLSDEGRIEVNLLRKGARKTQVTVQHDRLKDARAAEARKAFWRERLEALGRLLEGGKG
jgi:hypothetical protein